MWHWRPELSKWVGSRVCWIQHVFFMDFNAVWLRMCLVGATWYCMYLPLGRILPYPNVYSSPAAEWHLYLYRRPHPAQSLVPGTNQQAMLKQGWAEVWEHEVQVETLWRLCRSAMRTLHSQPETGERVLCRRLDCATCFCWCLMWIWCSGLVGAVRRSRWDLIL